MTLTDEEIRVKELQRKVAVILGWTEIYEQSDGMLCGISPADEHGISWDAALPRWHNDERGALQLCDRMHSEGWSYTITRYPERPEHFVTFGKPEHEGHHASDPSLARAVTLCFLAAHSNEN